MALEDLNPAVRVEEILDGADIEPATRLEYFMKKAANEVPKPAGSSDAGKAVLVNEDGDGFELGAAGGGATYVDVGNKTVAANSADYAIYVDGNELTSFAACKAYLEGIQDNDIRIRDRHGWQGISGLTINEDEGLQIAIIYQQIGTNAVRFGYAYEE